MRSSKILSEREDWVKGMNHSTLRGLLSKVFGLFPDEVKERTLYPNYYQYLLILKTVLPYLNESKDAKILDVGAGGGVIPLVLRRIGYECSAIDTWEEYSKVYDNRMGIKEDIIERLQRNGIRVEYCDIQKERFPFEDDSFDIVLLLDVIEHLHSSPKKPLKEIRRVLNKNGIIILTTPNLGTLKNRLFVLAGQSNYTDLSHWYHGDPFFGHAREYTPGEVKDMLTWEGFSVRRADLSNCLQMPAIKSFKLNPYVLPMALYLLITTLIPRFRYLMIVVAQKGRD
ncbi:MAG: putative methyltransferase YcgJ [candidate division WS2 bacterium]|nr:putative methyltransferase YcgJ [Candidatus Psychracetigena formicireducens]